MTVSSIEAKFKLSQNRSAEDRAGVIDALDTSGEGQSAAVAELMRRNAEG